MCRLETMRLLDRSKPLLVDFFVKKMKMMMSDGKLSTVLMYTPPFLDFFFFQDFRVLEKEFSNN
jgi:hypothetical protein